MRSLALNDTVSLSNALWKVEKITDEDGVNSDKVYHLVCTSRPKRWWQRSQRVAIVGRFIDALGIRGA